MVQPWPPWTSGMQSLMPMPAYWAPAGWQSYIGLMMLTRSLLMTSQPIVLPYLVCPYRRRPLVMAGLDPAIQKAWNALLVHWMARCGRAMTIAR